jgi:glycosyltransferase involved in cell wall biosynthesis
MTLRVLHIGKFFPPERGGMEVFLADLIAAQRAQGIEAFALVHGQPQPDDAPWLVRVPVQLKLVFAPLAVGFRSALADAIGRFEPHVLHLHMPNNAVFWALTLNTARALPWIVHWHSDVVVSSRQKLLACAYRVYRPFEQAVLDKAERIIATSPPYLEASEPLLRWREKCAIVPLGLAATPQAQHGGENKLPWRGERMRLLSIGRLTYYKGFETLIAAVAPLTDVQLVIVGDGELRADLQALVRTATPAGREPAVTLIGEVSERDKQALLRSCDAFCLASCERTEAFGLVLLEAMQQARPCIVSDLPGSGMSWLVREANAGWLVETGNVQAWQQAIEHCARHPAEREQKGHNGQQAQRERFTIETCAQAVSTQYVVSTADDTPEVVQRHNVLVVIPARDEAGTITMLLQALQLAGWTDVLVVDDHSSDGTGDLAQKAGARVLRPVLPMGAWGAMQAGIRYALAKGYHAVVTMDADGQHEVSELPLLLGMQSEADLVIGAHPERASTARKIAWSWFRRLAGFDLRDLTSGFRYYSQTAMQILASREATLLDYQDLGTLLMLRRAGLRIVEVPVAMNLRPVGKSRIFNSWFSVARYMAVTTLLCLSRLPIRRVKAPR